MQGDLLICQIINFYQALLVLFQIVHLKYLANLSRMVIGNQLVARALCLSFQ